jgi:hypothetical protein
VKQWAKLKETVRDLLGVYRSGHHDYVVREGEVVTADNIVGRSNETRWRLMAPIFRDAVGGRRVLDVGAHLGFFSVKALSQGAAHVTSLELDPGLCRRMRRVRLRHRRALGGRDRWTIAQGDFFESLVPVDTIFLFGITYHMVRYGMQRRILPEDDAYRALFRRIADLTTHGVIAEWGPPKRPSFETSPYWDQFSYENFQKALEEFFPGSVCLGQHDYYGAGREDPVRYIHYGHHQGQPPTA